MNNTTYKISDMLLRLLAEKGKINMDDCSRYFEGRDFKWADFVTARDLLNDEGLIAWIGTDGYSIRITSQGHTAAKTGFKRYITRKQNAPERMHKQMIISNIFSAIIGSVLTLIVSNWNDIIKLFRH